MDGQSWLSGKTLRQKLGQMIILGFPEMELTPALQERLAGLEVGNVILFAGNIASAAQLRKLNHGLREFLTQHTGVPPLIGVDQEGGMVSRMPPEASSLPAAMAVSAVPYRQKAAEEAGKITAQELRALGFSLDFAPVLDINSNSKNPVIGARSYGDTPERVSEMGLAFLKGLREGGILPVVKHFPGHGDTAVDSHLGLPSVERSLKELTDRELIPFQKAVDSGAEAVMTSHILFPQVEPEKKPATMSRTILTGLLREKMGFRGLIITDCLEMDAIQKYYGTPQGAVAAVQAGAELLCLSHSAELAEEVLDALEKAILSGELSEEAVDRAVKKILRYKQEYVFENAALPLPSLSLVGCEENREEMARISQDSITCIRETESGYVLPPNGRVLWLGCRPIRTTLANNAADPDFNFAGYMARAAGGDALITSHDPDDREISQTVETASSYDCAVLGMMDGLRGTGQLRLLKALCERVPQVVAVSLFHPYDAMAADPRASALAAYEYTELSLRSLLTVLKGEREPVGTLPVSMSNESLS